MSGIDPTNTLAHYYACTQWEEQIPVPAWDRIETFKKMHANNPQAITRRMGAVWQKMPECEKLDFVLANIHFEANQDTVKEQIAIVVAKCWERTQHMPKGYEVLKIREHCLRLRSPNLANEQHKRELLWTHDFHFENPNGERKTVTSELSCLSYYKEALAADSPQFKQFFSGEQARIPLHPQMGEFIEIHFGKKAPSTDFAEAAKFLFIAGAWGLKCEAYTQLFIDQIRTFPVNSENMDMFLELALENEPKLAPKMVIPFFDYLIRCGAEGPHGAANYYPFIGMIWRKLLPAFCDALHNWATQDWQTKIPNPSVDKIEFADVNDILIKDWDDLNNQEKILATTQLVSLLRTEMRDLLPETARADIDQILNHCRAWA